MWVPEPHENGCKGPEPARQPPTYGVPVYHSGT